LHWPREDENFQGKRHVKSDRAAAPRRREDCDLVNGCKVRAQILQPLHQILEGVRQTVTLSLIDEFPKRASRRKAEHATTGS
jgi:hypothetical protein